MPADTYAGLLCIGDPHLCSRPIGFRKDDYPQASLGKLRWCLALARSERLLPVILGDLFHFPRDNANWLTVEVIRLLEQQPVMGIAGNHDMSHSSLCDDDTLSVLLAAGCLRRVSVTPWVGTISGRRVVIGGTDWGQPIPSSVDRDRLVEESGVSNAVSNSADPLTVVWLTHHDMAFPGYLNFVPALACQPIEGVDLVVNGHIHKPMPDAVRGRTTWINPGNISRVARDDATREHRPSVLRIGFEADAICRQGITVPHQGFDQVFHAELVGDRVEVGRSVFIQGLSALQSIKTGGEGLRSFVNQNLEQFPDARVRQELLVLMEEVLGDGHQN